MFMATLITNPRSNSIERPAPCHTETNINIPHPPVLLSNAGTSPNESSRMTSRVPPEFSSQTEECLFVVICSMGQFLFALHLSNAFVNQITFIEALGISASNSPWLVGSFLVANGVSVVISGSLADLINPRWLILTAFLWLAAWNLVGVFSVTPSRVILFFLARAMVGFAVGTLCAAAMSMLGRIYKPGLRKNRVFSLMGAMIPLGFTFGGLQGGAFSAHLEWIFGSTAILSALCAVTSWWCIPPLKSDGLSLRQFDFAGATMGMAGCGLLIFGLTQGTPTHWTTYTYALVLVGMAFLALFFFVESRVERPLIENRLWKVPGFLPLMISYFLGYGAFTGSWLFYAIRFLLTTQAKTPIITACCLIPFGISGSIASWVVSKSLHKVLGHFILVGSMVAFTLGPVFFLPQSSGTLYWCLTFPGFVLSPFGPDMSFAAISVFITSNVPKSYQGAAGSLLITAQNLSSAVFTAIGDSIGERVTQQDSFSLDLPSLRAIWWFSFASCLLGGVLCTIFVRIPKSEEKEHVL